MNATTNIDGKKTPRTNKIIYTIFISLTTLVIGLVLGAAAAETGTGLLNATRMGHPAANPASSMASSNLKPGSLETWNPFQEIRDMQAQINQSCDKMYEQFRAEPQLGGFPEVPGYSLSLDVRDLKNSYEVQADLPDAKASDVHVSLKDGRTLNVAVDNKMIQASDQKNAATRMIELGEYDQVVQLPTPVKADQMKIQREGHELVITIPKAA